MIQNDFPQVLRHEGASLGKHDIVVASCSDTSLAKRGREEIASAILEPRVLIHRKHRLARNEQLSWEDLAGWLMLEPSDHRWPRPEVPREVIPQGMRFQEFQHYGEALATVRASGQRGKVACIGCTELHSADELRQLRSFSMQGFKAPIKLGAFKCRAAYEKQGFSGRLLVDKLSQHLATQLNSLGTSMHARNSRLSFPYGRLATYHVKRELASGNESTLLWVPGRIRYLSVLPRGEFEAEHVFYNRVGRNCRIECTVKGKLLESSQGLTQMTWSGTIHEDGSFYQEQYSCSFLYDQRTLGRDNPIVGFWSGVTTHQGKPDLGYMILMPKENKQFGSRERRVSELNDIVRNYRHGEHFENLDLELPEDNNFDAASVVKARPR